MSRSYRSIVLAAVGWLVLGAGPPNEGGISGNSAEQVTNATDSAGNYAAYPDVNADNCYQASQHDSADLCAQWRAAKAAERGVWVAAIGAFLSFVSIFLVVIALRQTNKANRIAREEFDLGRAEAADLARDTASMLAQATRSANIAYDALEDTRRRTALELRPYVYMFKSNNEVFVPPEGGVGARITIQLKNFGATPAKNVRTFWASATAMYPLVDVIPEQPPVDPHTGDIPPGEIKTMKLDTGNIKSMLPAIVERGTNALYIFGICHYEDSNGTKYYTRFRLFSRKEVFEQGLYAFHPEGNEAT